MAADDVAEAGQEGPGEGPQPEEAEEGRSLLPRERPFSVEQLVQMLQQAGARKEAIDFAKNLQSDICLRHRQTAQPHLQSSYDQTKSLA